VRFNIAIGTGDYATADQALAESIRSSQKAGVEGLLFLVRNSTLARAYGANGQPMGMGPEFLGGFQSTAQFVRSWADSWVLRGTLALEAGDTVRAEQYFRHALQLGRAGQASALSSMVVKQLAASQPLEVVTFAGAEASAPVPFSFTEQALALHYLNMLQNAKEQIAKKEPKTKLD
jgi:hypothetical protein